MCRSIRPLHRSQVDPTPGDVSDAALQYVRKLSGIRSPSKIDAAVFNAAVAEIAAATERLLAGLKPGNPVEGRIPLRHLHPR